MKLNQKQIQFIRELRENYIFTVFYKDNQVSFDNQDISLKYDTVLKKRTLQFLNQILLESGQVLNEIDPMIQIETNEFRFIGRFSKNKKEFQLNLMKTESFQLNIDKFKTVKN